MIRTALVTVVAGMALAVPAAPSQAARTQAAGCSGVAVVVDFAALGGGNQNGCAPGDPDSGVTALRSAGFEPTRAAQQPGYFVCRIDGRPADDPCQRASPADAYWSYWHAAPGGRWVFSNRGAAEYDPEPGTVEGWAFGAGDPPSQPPPARQRQASPPTAAPSPARSPRAPAPAPTAPAPRTRTSAPAADDTSAPTTAPASATPAPTPTPSSAPSSPAAAAVLPSASPSPEPPEVRRLAEPPLDQQGGTSPWVGVLLAGAIVAALGAAAAQQARRRR